jgi:hypothetical protein
MPDNGFNGSTITLGSGSLGTLRKIDVTVDGKKIDVTGSADSVHTYVTGAKDLQVDVEVVGNCTGDVDDSGAVAIVWNDGNSETLPANWVITNRKTGGSLDGDIVTTVTLVPTPT